MMNYLNYYFLFTALFLSSVSFAVSDAEIESYDTSPHSPQIVGEVKGLPFPIEDGFLVHVTKFMMSNSTAIAGSAWGENITDVDVAPETRSSLHHAYHTMVPDSVVESVGYLGGVIPIALNNSEDIGNKRRYAWMDRFKNFLGHTYGGEPNDTFTTSHRYGKESYVVIPEEDRYQFDATNPDYEGHVVLYKPEEKLREVVAGILLKDSGHVFDYERKPEKSAKKNEFSYWVKLDGQRLDDKPFVHFFREHGLMIANHNETVLQHYEMFLSPLVSSFRLHSIRQPAWEGLPPHEDLDLILSLCHFARGKLPDSFANFDKDTQAALMRWLDNNDKFVRLFDVELELRKQNRSLFYDNTKLSEHIKRRATLTTQEILDDLRELTEDEMEKVRGSRPWRMYIPPYVSELFLFDPQYYGELIEATPLSRSQKVYYQVNKLLALYLRTYEMDEDWVEALSQPLEALCGADRS